MNAAMQRKSRFLSIRRLWRRGGFSVSGGVRNLMTRRRLTPKEWVDQTYACGIKKIRRALTEKVATLPAASSQRVYVEKLLDLRDEMLLDEIYSRVHANPERAGCPPYRILVELATRTRSMDDPAWEHVLRCHPCSTEVRTMTRAYQPRPS
jgi:hypothetical protein